MKLKNRQVFSVWLWLSFLFLLNPVTLPAQQAYFSHWPEGVSGCRRHTGSAAIY